MNKKLNKQNGITLIALVITIIVMLILVAVTISMAVNGGLFNYAGKATGETQNAINAEQELADGRIKVEGTWYNSIDDYLNDIPSSDQREEKAEANTSYVGYYADTNNDGKVDGIIYADLAVGGTGEWGGQTYTIPTDTGFKEYYISKKNYDGPFGTKDVVSTKGTGNDRFYVMALTDYGSNGQTYNWFYQVACGASKEFGKGKVNTTELGERVGFDIFVEVRTNNGDDWFVPSNGEWAAFAKMLEDMEKSYTSCGLAANYWTSCIGVTIPALEYYPYALNFGTSSFLIEDESRSLSACFRLSRTF